MSEFKAKIVPVGNRVEIELSLDSQSGWGTATQQILVGEAERVYKHLGDVIRQAKQLQRPGVRKFGDH